MRSGFVAVIAFGPVHRRDVRVLADGHHRQLRLLPQEVRRRLLLTVDSAARAC